MTVALSVWRDEAKGITQSAGGEDDDAASGSDCEDGANGDSADNRQQRTSSPGRASSPAPNAPTRGAAPTTSSRAPSSDGVPDEDDLFDMDALFPEANAFSRTNAAASGSSTHGAPQKAAGKARSDDPFDDEDSEMWAAMHDLPGAFDDPPPPPPAPRSVVPPAPTRDADEDEDMWDVLDDLEKETQQPVSAQLPSGAQEPRPPLDATADGVDDLALNISAEDTAAPPSVPLIAVEISEIPNIDDSAAGVSQKPAAQAEEARGTNDEDWDDMYA